MDRTVITKRINRLACDIEKLKSTLAAIENTDIARYPENYNMLATDAALRSELIACRLRRLVFQSTDTKKPEYLASAGVVQGINIREENGVLKITGSAAKMRILSEPLVFDKLKEAVKKLTDQKAGVEIIMPQNSEDLNILEGVEIID